MACELAERTLADRLRECLGRGERGIPFGELLGCLREAAEGLDHLNRCGVQHRDVKPANLLLVGGSVKVGDYGLAKLLQGSLASHSGTMTPRLRGAGSVRGPADVALRPVRPGGQLLRAARRPAALRGQPP